MKRIAYWFYHALYKFKVYLARRFTRAGYALCILLVFAAIFGADTTLSTVFQIVTFVVFLLLIAFLLSIRTNTRFDVQRKLPRFATAGLAFQYDVSIRNPLNRSFDKLSVIDEFEAAGLSYREFCQVKPSSRLRQIVRRHKQGVAGLSHHLALKQGAAKEPQKHVDLQPGESKDLRMEMIPVRRGRIHMAGITVARTDPLGLCYARNFRPLSQTILVLPKRYPLPPIQMPGGRKHHSGGIALTTSVGESEEFVSLREYRPGDPLRKFHWKSWAKTGKPIVKEYQEEYFVRHVLILDTFVDKTQSEAFEDAVSLAASFACTVQTQESLLDLIFFGLEV